ncbi:hypothetical protein DFQ30_007918 [Apophysomyces sp. BC1015]|nr:hypothetical protein DFQ30_007918 [Apophysomyces sp. BC1015]
MFGQALANATPQELYDENVLRKKFNLPLLKDPHAPVRPSNMFFLYKSHLYKDDDAFKKLPGDQQCAIAAQKYHELSGDDLKQLKQRWKEAAVEFEEKNKDYRSRIRPRSYQEISVLLNEKFK